MFDLSVVAFDGRWLLLDESEGELGEFATKDEALKAAGGLNSGVRRRAVPSLLAGRIAE